MCIRDRKSSDQCVLKVRIASFFLTEDDKSFHKGALLPETKIIRNRFIMGMFTAVKSSPISELFPLVFAHQFVHIMKGSNVLHLNSATEKIFLPAAGI